MRTTTIDRNASDIRGRRIKSPTRNLKNDVPATLQRWLAETEATSPPSAEVADRLAAFASTGKTVNRRKSMGLGPLTDRAVAESYREHEASQR